MKKILVETSARHVHVTQETLEVLFGKGFQLTVKKMLSQPGQFASEQKVQVVGEKGALACSILGPVRPADQIEVSISEARKLGIVAPVRESGDVAGTPGCKLIGPKGEVEVKEGVMVAKRHIHLDPKTAEEFGLKDKQIVSLKVDSEERKLVFGDVVVRVSPKFAPAMHIDTDESNAAFAVPGMMGEIIVD